MAAHQLGLPVEGKGHGGRRAEPKESKCPSCRCLSGRARLSSSQPAISSFPTLHTHPSIHPIPSRPLTPPNFLQNSPTHLSSEKLSEACCRWLRLRFHSQIQPRSRATAASSAVAQLARLRGCGLVWPAQRQGGKGDKQL